MPTWKSGTPESGRQRPGLQELGLLTPKVRDQRAGSPSQGRRKSTDEAMGLLRDEWEKHDGAMEDPVPESTEGLESTFWRPWQRSSLEPHYGMQAGLDRAKYKGLVDQFKATG